MQYKLLTNESNLELTREINALLRNGWKLHGDTVVSICSNFFRERVPVYSQSLIKEDKEETGVSL